MDGVVLMKNLNVWVGVGGGGAMIGAEKESRVSLFGWLVVGLGFWNGLV